MSQNVTPTGHRKPDFRLLEERLVWARETAGLTQQQLADMLGISKRTVGNYESGVGYPKPPRLVLWANACDADYDFMAGDFYTDPTESSEVGSATRKSSGRVNPRLSDFDMAFAAA